MAHHIKGYAVRVYVLLADTQRNYQDKAEKGTAHGRYLHFSGDDKTPKKCIVEGDKKAHKIELFWASYAPTLVEGCSGCDRRKQVINDCKNSA